MTEASDHLASNASEYEYYMLRLHQPHLAVDHRGLIERLGTGEKRTFETTDELLQLLRFWSSTNQKMP